MNASVRRAVGGPGELRDHARRRAAALRRLAAVVDRRRRQPRAGRRPCSRSRATWRPAPRTRPRAAPRRAAAGAAAVPGRPSRSCGSRGSGADYVRPVIQGTGLRPWTAGVGHYVGTAVPGAGRQLRRRRAPHDLRRAVPRHRPAGQGRPRRRRDRGRAAYVYAVDRARDRDARPTSRSSRRCPSTPARSPPSAG